MKTARTGSRTYRAWEAMKYRCDNPNASMYRWYGARGITYCFRWALFDNFLADMGECPEGLELERINNDKGYYQTNCKWATHKEQCNNRRIRSDNKSGIPGVSMLAGRDRWVVMGDGKYIGSFNDFFEACCARKSWENQRGKASQ